MRVHIMVILLASVVAGCTNGGSPEPEPTAAETQEPEAAPVELPGTVNNEGVEDLSEDGATVSLELEADDFYFEPTFTKTAPGAQVSLEVFNEGSAEHTFTIDALRIDTQLAPDAGQSIVLTLPDEGPVRYYCRFHENQGMQGAFYFTDGGSADESPAVTEGTGG